MNRKAMFCLIILAGYFCSGNILAQSFEKGDKIINAGIKISIYKVANPDKEEDDEDVAASYTIPISFEYALTNKIGVGAEIGFCNYFIGKDTITGTIATANSLDILLFGNFHWV